ncbi:recombinase family protein [Pararhizobium arenae]|uniref:recombinase family protein n=1 Tax=Pararhizobium arenae TaxID=1856850 RepID=UPI00094B02D2|nr:recombinase family protein [Pararhizobium arenae]
MSTITKLRCAIYTRKSSEEGLDQAFNSLDAQREACEAYIASQASLGWKVLPELYDDGGISGGTMERPALQRLLRDIKDKKIDVVVVYKIDRLTRSLMDFSRIVEVFDGHGVSFVSITQQFNTTTSMGRLTLNVLLSFAQFEREVTAERIRDKVAASKKKGMWMGGPVPLGYRVNERKLIVDPEGAKTIKWLFSRYLDLKSLNDLSAAAQAEGLYWGPPARAAVASLTRGKMRHLLTNPIYLGKIRHKDAIYDGEHEAILDTEMFEQVQSLLATQAPTRRIGSNIPDRHLGGILCDANGQTLLTAHSQTHGKRYRYYVSRADTDRSSTAKKRLVGWRLPISLIEPIVEQHLHSLLADKSQLARWLDAHRCAADLGRSIENAAAIARRYREQEDPKTRHHILRQIYRRILIDANSITFEIRVASLLSLLNTRVGDESKVPANGIEEIAAISIPMRMKRRGNEERIVLQGNTHTPQPDPLLIAMLAKAHLYLEALTDGCETSIAEIGKRFNISGPDVSRLLPMAFLSPKVTEAILTGRQSPAITIARLTRMSDVSTEWTDHHKLIDL